MSEIEIEPKNILKTTLFGGIGLILVSLFFMSWTDVNPGEEVLFTDLILEESTKIMFIQKAPFLLLHGMK